MVKKGFFITIEGIEGVGKSTCVDFIKHYLEQAGKEVVLTREPGGTVLAEKIRGILLNHSNAEDLLPETELLLFFAGRIQHCKYIIGPALKRGCWVICDRFIDASYAYQGGGRGIEPDRIEQLESFIENRPVPDLTLLLDAPYDIVENRFQERSFLDRIEQEEKPFFLKVQQTYLKLASDHPDRFRVVDASAPIEKVTDNIKNILDTYLQQS